MNSSCRFIRSLLIFNHHCRAHIQNITGTSVRQSVSCNRVINEQQTLSRRFTTCARAYVNSVQKFGRKYREKLIAKEKLKMSGDSIPVLAPLQAAVKEKVRLDSAKINKINIRLLPVISKTDN